VARDLQSSLARLLFVSMFSFPNHGTRNRPRIAPLVSVCFVSVRFLVSFFSFNVARNPRRNIFRVDYASC